MNNKQHVSLIHHPRRYISHTRPSPRPPLECVFRSKREISVKSFGISPHGVVILPENYLSARFVM